MSKQGSFLQIALNKKKLKCERFLDEMDAIIPWKELLEAIEPYYQKHDVGRRKMDLQLMLKVYFLQQWYDLSDPGVEEAIYDRTSFQKFLNMDLLADIVPDESTVLHFRHFLEKHDLHEELFELIQQLLTEHGLLMKEGTIVDATILRAPSSIKNDAGKRDDEMSSTKKGGQYYFGTKAHIGVDSKSGLVHTVKTTTAKVHDSQMKEELWREDDKVRFGDSAYFKKAELVECRKAGVFYGVLKHPSRYVKISKSEKKQYQKWSGVRSKVEFPFRIIKCLWKHAKVRYKGLKKNTVQIVMLFALANLYSVRKKLLSGC